MNSQSLLWLIVVTTNEEIDVAEDILEVQDVISVVAVTPIVVTAVGVPANEHPSQLSGSTCEHPKHMAATYLAKSIDCVEHCS
jgi:hypothetical protein